MNVALVTTFRQVATDLLLQFGRPVVRTRGLVTATVQAVVEQEAAAVGEYGERVESRWVATLTTASGTQVGDVLAVDGANWTLTQLLEDDGFVRRFALRAVT